MPSDVVISHLMVPPSMVRQAKGAASIEHLPAYHSPLAVDTRAQSRLPTFKGSFAAHQVKRKRLAIHCASEADRKSTRLNSSHVRISYAVFCLKKKKKNTKSTS